MSTSWLRIVTYTTADRGVAVAERLEDRIQDGARLLIGRPGYRGGHWGFDSRSGAFAAVTNWDSLEAIEALTTELAELHETRRAQGFTVSGTANLGLVTSPEVWSAEHWAAMTGRRSPTWMRVALYEPVAPAAGPPVQLADSAGETAFLLKGVRGFLTGYWGRDPGTGRIAAVTYWAARDAIDAAASQLDHVHAVRAQQGAMTAEILNLRLLTARAPAASEVRAAPAGS